MNSQVKSQISDKVYEATLDDLSELDQGLEVDLYKLNVFNKDIMIAPGKVMSDTKKDIHYCYVYVIKNGKVAAKLGIYETHVKRGEVYDLTDFEGREFLLFDHYYNEPGSLVAFEMKEEVQVDNIFDYLKRFLKPVTNATAAIKEQAAVIRKVSKRMEGNPMATHLKNYKRQKPYDEAWLDSFKEDAENWMFNLLVLEVVFNIKFIFENSDGSEDDMREMIRASPNESTTIIRVSLEDIPRHIANNAPKATALVEEEEEEEEEEEFVKDTFPSPRTESPPIPSEVKVSKPEPIAESKQVKSFSSKPSPEAKPVKSFSSKPRPETSELKESASKPSPISESKSVKVSAEASEVKVSSKPSPEAKPAKSFSSKPRPESSEVKASASKASKARPESSEVKASASKPSPVAEAKPAKSFSSKASKASAEASEVKVSSKPSPEEKPVKSFSSKASKASFEESEVPEPRTESPPRPPPSVRKAVSPAPRSVSPVQRAVSPSPAEGPPKPKRISFSAPVKKLKNAAP
jgi:hypothetical protein